LLIGEGRILEIFMFFEEIKNRIESSGKLAEIATTAVGNMGDIFWDAAGHGQTENLPEDIAEECVKDAIINGLKAALDSDELNEDKGDPYLQALLDFKNVLSCGGCIADLDSMITERAL
jgi:hypothetical protein